MTTTLAVLLSVLALLGTAGLLGVLALLALWWASHGAGRKARHAALLACGTGTVYLTLLVLASVASREVVLPPGAEKYFCELDCHLAYRVVSVAPGPAEPGEDTLWAVVLQTRFDETTISTRRPRDATLTPAPRRLRLRTVAGDFQPPLATGEAAGPGSPDGSLPLDRPLLPGESYLTTLRFRLPAGGRPEALLIEDDVPVSRWLIGHERSPLHAKVLLALPRTLALP